MPLPESRTEVVGHAAARASMLAALDAARLPGGILLHGPRGIGKATLAFDIARDDLRPHRRREPRSTSPRRSRPARYPNLRVLRKAPRDTGKGFYTAIRVEEVRGLIERVRGMTRGRAGLPHRHRRRDRRLQSVARPTRCSRSSRSRRPETLFLLVSHRPGGLLPTIRSRCRAVALRPLSDGDVRAVLGDQRRALDARRRAGRRPAAARLRGAGAGRRMPALTALQGWLKAPGNGAGRGPSRASPTRWPPTRTAPAFAFGRDMLTDWIAAEARTPRKSGAKAAACLGQRRYGTRPPPCLPTPTNTTSTPGRR